MTRSTTSSMHRAIVCGSFRVEFASVGDRVGHAIYVADEVGDGANEVLAWRELLRSVEDADDAAWPASPPLQELHVELRDGQSVALLVGRAGKSHWSASVGLEASENGRERLAFDVACRVSAIPNVLGSAYQLAEGVTWARQTASRQTASQQTASQQTASRSSAIADGDDARPHSVVLHATDGSAWELGVDGPGSFVALTSSSALSVKPDSGVAAVPATLRWRYSLRRRPGVG